MQCATQSKLEWWPKWSGQQWSNILLLDSCNVCPSDQILKYPGRRPQEVRGVIQQDVGERAELHPQVGSIPSSKPNVEKLKHLIHQNYYVALF